MNKKAQGLPMNVIIIAILVMLVLVVVGVIFMSRLGIFVTEVGDCLGAPGNHICTTNSACQFDANDEPVRGYRVDKNFNCADLDDQPQYCCLKIGA